MKRFFSPSKFIVVVFVMCYIYQCSGQIENGGFNPSGENIRRVFLPVPRLVPVNREEPRRVVISSSDTTDTTDASEFSPMTSLMSIIAILAMALILLPAIIQTTTTTTTSVIIPTTQIATTTPGVSTTTGRGSDGG